MKIRNSSDCLNTVHFIQTIDGYRLTPLSNICQTDVLFDKTPEYFKALLNSDHVTPIPFGHFAIVLTSCYRRAASPLPRRPEKCTITS